MTEFQEYASYGAVGAAAFVIIKWVLPLFHAVVSKANVESATYGNAKDLIDYTSEHLKTMQSRYDSLQQRFFELEKELESERSKCRELQLKLDEIKRLNT